MRPGVVETKSGVGFVICAGRLSDRPQESTCSGEEECGRKHHPRDDMGVVGRYGERRRSVRIRGRRRPAAGAGPCDAPAYPTTRRGRGAGSRPVPRSRRRVRRPTARNAASTAVAAPIAVRAARARCPEWTGAVRTTGSGSERSSTARRRRSRDGGSAVARSAPAGRGVRTSWRPSSRGRSVWPRPSSRGRSACRQGRRCRARTHRRRGWCRTWASPSCLGERASWGPGDGDEIRP